MKQASRRLEKFHLLKIVLAWSLLAFLIVGCGGDGGSGSSSDKEESLIGIWHSVSVDMESGIIGDDLFEIAFHETAYVLYYWGDIEQEGNYTISDDMITFERTSDSIYEYELIGLDDNDVQFSIEGSKLTLYFSDGAQDFGGDSLFSITFEKGPRPEVGVSGPAVAEPAVDDSGEVTGS